MRRVVVAGPARRSADRSGRPAVRRRGVSAIAPVRVPVFEPAEADDAMWMQRALEQATRAAAAAEVPVGAVVVRGGQLVAEAYNLTRVRGDPMAHAEMIAIERVIARTHETRLLDFTLYVTLEPCAMCAGALVLAKLGRLVYGARDPKAGMCGSLACIVQDSRLNHRVRLTEGVLESAAGELLRSFFRVRR